MINIIKWSDYLQLKQYLRNRIIDNHLTNNEVLWLTFNEKEFDLNNYLIQNSLINNYKLIIIDNCSFLNSQSSFQKHLNLIDNLTKYYLDYDFFLLTNKIIVKNDFLIKNNLDAEIIELKTIDDKQKQIIVNDWLNKNKLTLSKSVYSHLLTNLNCDFGIINNELTKLKNAINSNFSEDEQKDLISNYNQENVFNLLEMFLLHKYDDAWRIYQYLIYKQEDELTIINALNAQIFNLYIVLKLLKNNYSITKIQEITGLHIYIINLYKSKFINYNINNLLNLVHNLYSLEKDIKLQKMDKKIGLKSLLIKL